MTRANLRMERLGDELRHVIAPLVSNAVEHIASELLIADSYPDHTPGAADPTPLPYLEPRQCKHCKGTGWYAVNNEPTACDHCDARGTVKLTAVEKAAQKRYELLTRREEIRDLLVSVEELVRSLRHQCDSALRTRAVDPREAKREKPICRADPGLEGYLVPLADGGWHDPTCTRLARSMAGGMCDAHRKQYDRWRERQGLKPLTDERSVQFDSEVHYVEGVAIVRSVA
jgi:hypothetical protein